VLRNIKGIFSAKRVNMGGIYLDQALPIAELEQLDPFLLIHHWNQTLEGGQKQKEVGVGPHPHRGFSPVTLIYKGSVHHRDSRGMDSIVREGGAQWMNSGMGIVHSERPDAELAEKGGNFEIIQFWVNTPAKYKMLEPEYYPMDKSSIPEVISEDGKVSLGIIAGAINGINRKSKTNTELLICKITANKDGKMLVNVPEDYNAMIYQLDGELLINHSFTSRSKNLVWFKNIGDQISLEGRKDSRAVLLAGKPIGEEVTTYGSFVMNNQTEILTAIRDYQQGKMGILIEEF